MSERGDRAGAPDDALEELLGAFVERRERGERVSPEDFCREHPEGGEALLPLLREMSSTEALFPSGPVDLPARVGPYRVTGELGRGGMGRVLSVVHDERPDETLALKLLHLPLSEQTRTIERFRREGSALARISHPAVVRVYETGLYDRRPFIAMERVEGTSLADAVRRARERIETSGVARTEALQLPGVGSTHERIAHIVATIARAIAAVHREGVLHRDLNPRNVLLRPDGEPVVIDFGLMRSSIDPTLTGSGDVLGTPQYMAPEQARGERVDERSDVFGLGCCLRELLSLAPPRDVAGALTVLKLAGSQPLVRLRTWEPDVPAALAIIADRATAFLPRWRYASADGMARDLDAWIAGDPIAARRASWAERAFESWCRRRTSWVAAGVVLVVAASATAWTLTAAVDPRVLEAATVQELDRVFVSWLDGDLVRAREAWRRFVALAPEHPLGEFIGALCADDLERDSARPAIRALLAGERARRAGRYDEAANSFASAWDVSPGFPCITLLRGLAEFEGGQFEHARGKLEGVAFHYGASKHLHTTLAALYSGLGAFEDAGRAARAALQIDADDPAALWMLARACAERGDFAGAETAARHALARDFDAHEDDAAALVRVLEAKGAADVAARVGREVDRLHAGSVQYRSETESPAERPLH